ncbi:MAG: hemolysin family protein [Pseudomonadota bacterium]
MGDISDGSSSAAQSAHDYLNTNDGTESAEDSRTPGLLRRLVHAFNPTDSDDEINQAAQVHLGRAGLGNLLTKRVEDVAIPRAEIVAVSTDSDLGDILEVFRESGLSRLPVFEDTLDTPTGMLHLKDLALQHGFNGTPDDFSVAPMVRSVLFVPPSMPIGVLLQKMQTERRHMALVIDEYGGVDGLVTLEDLIEEVLGEIEDEHDVEEANPWRQEKPGTYVVLAKASLGEFEAEIGQRLSDDEIDEEIDTLGGLVFMLSGRVPARGEMIVGPSGAEFEIVEADPRKIKRLRVFVPSSDQD